jgi:hypothetical protein
MPNMIGLVLGKTWQATLICLQGGGPPEACSQKTGLSLELTKFWSQTDLHGHFDQGQIPLKFQLMDGTEVDLVALQPIAAIFGAAPLAGSEIIPGRAVVLRLGPANPPLGMPHLGRFPQKGDTGFEVLMLQAALTDHGFPTATNGHWDDETEKQRIAFAESVGLLVFIHVPGDKHAATIQNVWQALRLPINEAGVPGLPGPAGAFPDG